MIALTVSAVLLAACSSYQGSAASSSSAAGDDVKIGLITAMSGPGAPQFEGLAKGKSSEVL